MPPACPLRLALHAIRLRAHPNYQLSCSANNLAQHIKALVARFKKAELATPPANEFSERLYHLMKTAVTSMDRIQDESKAEQQHTARPSSMQHRGGDQLQLGAGSSGGGAGAASPGGAAEASGSAQPSAKRARLMDGSAAASAAASEALQAATRAAHVAEREVEAATQRALSAADSGDLPQAARAFVALQRELTTLVLEQQREFLGRMEIQQRAFFAMVEAMHRASPTQAQPQAAANAAVPAPTTAVAPTHVTSVAPMTTVPPEAGAGAAAPATSRPADGAIGASSDALGASSDAIGGELAPMQTAGATGGAAEAPTLPPSTSHSA